MQRIVTIVGLILLIPTIYITFFYPSKEKEIDCELKTFSLKKETDVYVEYRLTDKMVRRLPISVCKTNNVINHEYFFVRKPVILLAPFRPGVTLPNTNKEYFLEE